jgi:hypothetical protein
MKIFLIASTIAIGTLTSLNTNAVSFDVTNMLFYNNPSFEILLAATGTLVDDGNGSITGIDTFLGNNWDMSQETALMSNTGSWSGATGDTGVADDVFDYTDEIAAMTNEQIAIGLYFNWNTISTTAVLAIFDCTGSGTVEDPLGCVAADAVALDNGAFQGSFISVNEVPVPAAIWLMGSGILAFAGFARRRM